MVCKVYVSVRGHLKFWALGSLTKRNGGKREDREMDRERERK
jgi:hypothetical protein